jgi:hypothetical protein
VDKFLIELQSQLDERQVSVEVDEEARLWLGGKRLRCDDGRSPFGAGYTRTHQKSHWPIWCCLARSQKAVLQASQVNEDHSALVVAALVDAEEAGGGVR